MRGTAARIRNTTLLPPLRCPRGTDSRVEVHGSDGMRNKRSWVAVRTNVIVAQREARQ